MFLKTRFLKQEQKNKIETIPTLSRTRLPSSKAYGGTACHFVQEETVHIFHPFFGGVGSKNLFLVG